MIPYSRHTITSEDIRAVTQNLKSDWLTQGPAGRDFESAIAKYCRSKYAVGFSNGTAALQAAYYAIGLKKGDEIITSPMTFAATSNAAIWQGGVPVFADIDERGLIDPKNIEKKITSKTKAIVSVDYSGMPVDYDEIRKIARKHKLVFIADGAHSLGAEYKGKKVGSLADMTMFSFHPVKSITTGEGGMIVTDYPEYAEKLRLFRSHGITKDASKYVRMSEGDWYHEMQDLGQNFRLTDIQSALGISQLKRLDQFIKRREQIVKKYNKELRDIPNLILPEIPSPKDRRSSWHLYPLRFNGALQKNRAIIFAELKKEGIGVQVHYIPVYRHPYYEKIGYKKGLCPKAEEFYEQEISMPVYPLLKDRDQAYVIKKLKEILESLV